MADNDITWSRIDAKAAVRWQLVRDICAGGDEDALGKYLPYLNKHDTSAENTARNAAYRERAVLYNATGRTRDGLLGLAFLRDPKGLDKLPTRLQYLTDDCDGAGISLYQQSQATLCNILETGRHGLFVDYAEELSAPIVKAYKAEDIINWRTANVGGKVVLTLVVLQEMDELEAGYAVEAMPQWRELLLQDGVFTVRIWKQLDEKSDPVVVQEIVPRSVGGALDFIPFVFVGAQNNDPAIDEAPLYDLAYVNRAHYRNSADYEDSVFLVGQAQPWISGLTEEWRDHLEKGGKTYTGSRAAMLLPQGGSYGFAQAEPNSMAKEAMDQKEAQMLSLGARLVEATRAANTATESANDKEASTSVLSMCAANVSEAYSTAIAWCARYLDLALDDDVGYAINQDFTSMKAEANLITALVAGWQSGAYAKPDLRAFLRRIGVIPVDRSDDEIEGDLQGEGPALGEMGGDPMQMAEGDPAEPAIGQPTKPGAAPAVGAAPKPAAAPAAPDMSALTAAAEAIAKAAERMAPLDLAPLIAAINEREAATLELDVQPIADAVAEALRSMPAPVVNVAAPEAPTFNIDATTTVHPQSINVEAPSVSIEPAQVNVAAPPAPDVTVPVNVNVERNSGNKTGTMKRNPDGSYSMEVKDDGAPE